MNWHVFLAQSRGEHVAFFVFIFPFFIYTKAHEENTFNTITQV